MDITALRKKLTNKLPQPVFDVLVKLYQTRGLAFVPGPLTYNQDGLASKHNCDFMQEPRFAKAYELGRKTGSWEKYNIHWRIHTLCFAATVAARHEGDFVECGVNKGGFSRAVMSYINFSGLPKTFWLLDTFCGLVEKSLTPEERVRGIKPGGYAPCYDQVLETFREFKNVKIIKGEIPGTLKEVTAEKVCYLSIDMNCAAPEIAAAEFFWDRLVKGAMVVLDDYGFAKHIGQKRAFDEFAARRGTEILHLPTGQGLIIR